MNSIKLPDPRSTLPTAPASYRLIHSLVVQGEFTRVNQGNKSKRVMIGFGPGAGEVKAHVTVSLTTDTQPIIFAEFNLNSQSGKKPGAAATMGVGSAAAGVATGSAGDKRETVEADAARMATAVARQIKEAMISQPLGCHAADPRKEE